MEIDTTNAMVSLSLILGIVSNIIHIVNHKRIRSNCCGRKLEASLDISSVESISPK
jgi:hypothetical protein